MKVSIVLNAPEFGEGDRVFCNGDLYKGWGKVVEVRYIGEGGFQNDTYPQVIVKPDDYKGGKYGARTLIRYNGEDLEAGKLLSEANAPKAKAVANVMAEPKAATMNDLATKLDAILEYLKENL